ncbi:dihydroorotase [Clostridium sp. MD294]|uniref:dihydroorotase n=1 Tax=Clostridium sp. MD294 TaxID=97138 RepID=UPI0002CA802F|nr:dihydroorotase [Clostridium sp. MD294]NDO45546.1 dihydroorotase [Clostridium sp. MD294]USF30801.1 Dihydroorotase [Clostridium sp. MD294]
MKILIQNGQVIDPASQTNEVMDILIENGIISKIEKNITDKADKTINAEGNWVTPGFIDVHVHLREPGYEYKETIATGTRSAAKGGYTTICPMPNTNPVCDSDIMIEYIKLKAEREGVIHVLPIGAITKGQKGEELSNIGKMAKAGACAISEDGKSVPSSGLLKTAMKYAKMFDIPVLSHCEDINLVAGGSMNAGASAQLLGLKGISNDSEEVIVARDIILAKSTNSKLHICHMSTKGSVELLRQAKSAGQTVTAEATPHHFTLSDDFITDYDGNTKMNPPLRSKEDVLAIRQALKDNVIEIIATDHAPHSIDEKNCEYERVAFGIVGLETALPLGITVLVEEGWLTPMELIAKMTYNPAKMLNIDKGTLTVGKAADITIVDPNKIYKIDTDTFASKSKNTPFGGFEVKGKVIYTIVDGNIVVENGELVEQLN